MCVYCKTSFFPAETSYLSSRTTRDYLACLHVDLCADLPTDAFIRHMDSVSVAHLLCCVRVMFGERVLFIWTLSLAEVWFCWSFFLGVRLHGWCQEYSWNSKLGSSLTRKAKLCGWVQRYGSCGDIPKADHICGGLRRRAGYEPVSEERGMSRLR